MSHPFGLRLRLRLRLRARLLVCSTISVITPELLLATQSIDLRRGRPSSACMQGRFATVASQQGHTGRQARRRSNERDSMALLDPELLKKHVPEYFPRVMEQMLPLRASSRRAVETAMDQQEQTTEQPPATDRIAIAFAGTCDLAMWCKLLRDKGWSGPRIARALGRSEGYVNNLIRVVDRASPAVMLRWREEQSGLIVPVCATDWLVQICLLPHDQQNVELARRVAEGEIVR
jgi:hypothetical protein